MFPKIIRGERVEGHVTLSLKGKLLAAKEESAEFVRGRKEGEDCGYKQAQSEMVALLDLLQTVSGKLLEQKKRLLELLKPQIVQLAMAICERVIRQELSQPQTLVKLINSILSSTSPALEEDLVKIYLSPDDLLMLENRLTDITSHRREVKTLRFLSDPLITRGDCRIETKTHIVNASVTRELEDLRSKILMHG